MSMSFVFDVFSQGDGWYYLLIPIVSGVIGFGTNALGILMMFKPLEFVGIKPVFGWQGIVPARAKKFAGLQFDQVEKLIDIGAVLKRVDTNEMCEILEPNLYLLIEDLLEADEKNHSAVYWHNLPGFVKQWICQSAAKELPKDIDKLMRDIQANHHALIDAKEIVVNKLDGEKHLLVDLVRKTIDNELKFLVKSGLYLGFLFGIFQMFLFMHFPDIWYVLPIGGFLVGYLTNWIAIKLMFRPLEPIKIGPFTLQGLFIKRKNEVARDYAETLTKSVLNARTMADYIVSAHSNSPIKKLIRYHIKKTIDNTMGGGKYAMLLSMGTSRYLQFQRDMIDCIYGTSVPMPIWQTIEYTERAVDLGEIIETRMRAFTPTELDGFVRPVFEQDEWILYVVGGVLGCLAGWVQFLTMFA